MKIKYEKSDLISFISFVFLFVLMTKGGFVKYVLLLGITIFLFLIKGKVNAKMHVITLHVLCYVSVGLILSLFNRNISLDSIKQILIFSSAPLLSISIFTLYGREESNKLMRIQFYALCTAYLVMYARYFTIEQFYFESCFYAYIFGCYVLWFLIKKQYMLTGIAVVFTLFDHKRIVNAAVIMCAFCLIIIMYSKKIEIQKFIFFLEQMIIIVLPIVWVYLCSSDWLVKFFAQKGINTMGRLEGTGAWNIVKQFYYFSISYVGKGSGWVLNWLEKANIFGFSNLHNDFLTAYIELGFIGYLLWLASFVGINVYVKKHNGVQYANIVGLYVGFMFVNFLTDNIYIYITFLVPFNILLLDIIFGNGKTDKYMKGTQNDYFPGDYSNA